MIQGRIKDHLKIVCSENKGTFCSLFCSITHFQNLFCAYRPLVTMARQSKQHMAQNGTAYSKLFQQLFILPFPNPILLPLFKVNGVDGGRGEYVRIVVEYRRKTVAI